MSADTKPVIAPQPSSNNPVAHAYVAAALIAIFLMYGFLDPIADAAAEFFGRLI